jgi:hypothetical protein
MPPKREQRLGQDTFYPGFPDHMFVAWIGNWRLDGFPATKVLSLRAIPNQSPNCSASTKASHTCLRETHQQDFPFYAI